MKKFFKIFMIAVFSTIMIYPGEQVEAQSIFGLESIGLTSYFEPAKLSGIKMFPTEPFRFDFILNQGDQSAFTENQIHEESLRLIKYFMASLTVPEGDLWVNLSPYEKDRIIPDILGQTEMGQKLLAQDYILKQITSYLMHPENEVGKEFWSAVYSKAYEQFGRVDIPTDTFNKVWIVPDQIKVYQNIDVAYVVNATMKVMLEEDYLARENAVVEKTDQDFTKETKEIIKQNILPVIQQEINSGEHFAPLRQIFNSMILAKWYEKNFKNSVIGHKYVDQKKIQSLEEVGNNISIESIYKKYIEFFKIGMGDVIQEEYDPMSQKMVTRKYFSGGADFDGKLDFSQVSGVEQNQIKSFLDVNNSYRIEIDTDPAMFGFKNLFSSKKDFPDLEKKLIFEKTEKGYQLEYEGRFLEFLGEGNYKAAFKWHDKVILITKGSVDEYERLFYFTKNNAEHILKEYSGEFFPHYYGQGKLKSNQKFFVLKFIDGEKLNLEDSRHLKIFKTLLRSLVLNGILVEDILKEGNVLISNNKGYVADIDFVSTHASKVPEERFRFARMFYIGVIDEQAYGDVSIPIINHLVKFVGDIEWSDAAMLDSYQQIKTDQNDWDIQLNGDDWKKGGIDLNNLNIESEGIVIDMQMDSAMINMNIPALFPQIISISKFEDKAQLSEFLRLNTTFPLDPVGDDQEDLYARDELFVDKA